MAPALTSSNPFHLRTTTTTTRIATRRRRNPNVVHVPRRPFVHAKLQNSSSSEDKLARPKGFFFDFNGKLPEAKSLVPAAVNLSTSKSLLFANQRRKDPNTVFVAGATGQTGVRITQTLLRSGFTVRAGVVDLSAAQELARLAAKYKVISLEEAKRLNAVESSFVDAEAIARAMGNAGKVVITVGLGENGPSAEVTTKDALEVVRAAELAGVGHVAVVYDSAKTGLSGPPSSTYNVLDGITSFFSNLFSRSNSPTLSEFLSKVAETNVSYTLVKAALTDDIYADSSNSIVVFREEGDSNSGAATTIDYKVSKSQIATLVAGVLSNTVAAENKVVEVRTSPSATSKSIEELFSSIPEDGRRKAYREGLAKAKAEEEALIASEKAREAAEAAKKLEEEVKKLTEQEARAASLAEEARKKAEAAGSSLEGILSKAKDFQSDFSWDKLSSQFSVVKKIAEEGPKIQIATVRGQAKARSLPAQKAVVKKTVPPKPKAKERPEAKPEVRKVFGGLFQQETIYMDD